NVPRRCRVLEIAANRVADVQNDVYFLRCKISGSRASSRRETVITCDRALVAQCTKRSYSGKHPTEGHHFHCRVIAGIQRMHIHLEVLQREVSIRRKRSRAVTDTIERE